MKKTLLLFAMLLGVVGAWAAATQPETGVYVISGDENGRRGNLAACEGISNFPALSNINWPGQNYHNNSVAAITNGEHWYVLKVYNRYVIYNLGLNKYLVKEGNNINFGDKPYLWQILVNGNYNSIYDEVGTYISFACGTKPNASTRNVKFNNSSTDGGSLHTFTVVADGEQTYANQIGEVTKNAPIELSYELTDELGNVYTGMYAGFAGTDLPTLTGLTFTSNRWENNKLYANITFPFPVSDAETTKKMMINGYTYSNQNFKWYAKDNTHIKVNEGSAPTIENVNNYLWAIYPSFNDGVFTYAIKNVATGKYITSSATGGAHNDNTLGFNDTGISFTLVKDSWGYAFKVADKNLYLSINSSTDGKGEQPLGLHGNTHDGTSLSFIPYVVNYTIIDEANNIYTGEGEGWAGLQIEPVFTGAAGYSLTNKVWDGNTFTANITFPFPVSSETVANPILIGQGTWQNADKKWTVVGNNVKVVNGTPSLGASMWLIYPTLTGSEFTYKIKSVSTDKYVTANMKSENDAEANNTPVTLTLNGTEFSYKATTCGTDMGFAYTNDYGTVMYLTRNGESDNDKLLGVHQAKDSHKGNGIRFPEFTEYNVTIGETGYTTVYSPFTAFTYSEDLEIYTITSAPQDGRVNLNLITSPQAADVSNYIYENQGVIIKGTPGGTYTFNLTDWEDYYKAEDWKNNLLEGSVTNTYVEGDAYVLSAPDGVESVGLYKALLNKDANGESGDTHFKNNAGKAYLPASALSAEAAESRFFLFGFGDDMETGITETENGNVKTENDEVYDLSGRRVQGAQKGIFIVNGKKVVR